MKYVIFFLTVLSLLLNSCKDNAVDPPAEEFVLSGVWFNSSSKQGIQIFSNKQVCILKVDSEGFLREDSNNPYMVFTDADLDSWTAVELLGDTLKGKFIKTDTSLTLTTEFRNGVPVTPPVTLNYNRAYIGDLVVLLKYLSCNYLTATNVSCSYSNGTFIISGSKSFEGAVSIRVTASHTGLYELSNINKGGYSYGSEYGTNAQHTGEIMINMLDMNKRYISGTFNFEAVNSSGSTINIKNGKFGSSF